MLLHSEIDVGQGYVGYEGVLDSCEIPCSALFSLSILCFTPFKFKNTVPSQSYAA